jgi:hexosaminidase
MKLRHIVCYLICGLPLLGCGDNVMPSPDVPDAGVPAPDYQEIVNRMAADLRVTYAVVDTHGAQREIDCKALAADFASCHIARLELANQGGELLAGDWTIYFHSIRRILSVNSQEFTITHINGDLHALRPTDDFAGFAAGETKTIDFIAEYWTLYQSDFMPRYYVSAGDAESRIIANTDTDDASAYAGPIAGDNRKRTLQDNNVFATARTRYEGNLELSQLTAEEVDLAVIPTPVVLESQGTEYLDISPGLNIQEDVQIPPASLEVLQNRLQQLGATVSQDANAVPFTAVVDPAQFVGDDAPYGISGGYRLDIGELGIQIVGYDAAGAFHGVQTVMALLRAGASDTIRLPHVLIKDAPRFPHRGIHVDVARNFRSKEVVKRFIEQMAAYKLNKLHLHLSDDEGWRVEIAGLPELTDVGGRRCHDLEEQRCLLPQLGSGPFDDNSGSGYYSKEDYVEIVRHANAHFIEVIPEIDMPAHARAAIIAMEARYRSLVQNGDQAAAEQYRLRDPGDVSNYTSVQFYDDSYLNPCQPSTFRFIEKVLDEMIAMHELAGQPLTAWHMGGDEAKNIHLGGGYEDLGGTTDWKGTIDQSMEDLPWARSPQCQMLLASEPEIGGIEQLGAYFARRVSDIVTQRGISTLVAWQDGLKGIDAASELSVSETMVNFWETLYWGGFETVNEWVAKGFSVVLSNPDYLYFDFPHEVDPEERGYYWAARYIDTKKVFSFAPENLPQNAETSLDRDGNPFSAVSTAAQVSYKGIQGQLWSETIRSDQHFEYMAFPRLLALAERAWHRADWELDYQPDRTFEANVTAHVDAAALALDWNRFANVLGQKELAKLDAAGVAYRVPVPGAVIEDGTLSANVEFPTLRIQYKDKDGVWQPYDAENKPSVTTTEVRALSADGRAGRAVVVEP